MAEGKENHERVAVALAIGPGGREAQYSFCVRGIA